MSVPAWARKGVRDVCVDDSLFDGRPPPVEGMPTLGEVYTITEVRDDYQRRGPHCVLKEHPRIRFGFDTGWRLCRFRPLVDDSDEALERDAEFFRQFLKAPEHSVTTPSERIEEGVDERV